MVKNFLKPKPLPISLNKISSRNGLVKNKLSKLLNRANQNIQNGRFDNFSKRKKQHIYKRLNRYAQRLSLGLRRTATGFVIVMSTSFSSNAQSFTEITTTSSPFIFHENPMGNLSTYQKSHVSFGDLDGDGDLDMIYGEDNLFTAIDANFYYAENIGTTTNPIFTTPLTNPFGLLPTEGGSTPVFVDIDGDLDLDLFSGDRNSNVLFYENTGSVSSPAFGAGAIDTFGMSIYYNVYLPRLSFANIDADGDMDFYLVNDYGVLFYHENSGTDSIPNFNLPPVQNPYTWQMPDYSKLTLGDLDGDGDLDIVAAVDTLNNFYENTGTDSIPVFTLPPVQNKYNLHNVSNIDTPTFVDIDGDSDLDYVTGSYEGKFYFQKNDSATTPPNFENNIAKLNQESAIAFVDIDGDGDLDMFSGEYDTNLYFYKNNGTSTNPSFPSTPEINPFSLTAVGSNYSSAPTFVDIDGDSDMDMFAGEYDGDLYYFENTGSVLAPSFAAPVVNPFSLTKVNSYSVPTFVDVDADMDLDAFVGATDGKIYFYENTGSVLAPSFAARVENPFGFSDVGSNSNISFVDMDGDNDFDAFVGEQAGNTNFFENIGTDSIPNFNLSPASEPFGLTDVGDWSKPVFADLDGDSDMDAFIGAYSGNFVFFENAVVLPVELSFFQAKRKGEKTRLLWQTESEQNNAGFEIERAIEFGNELLWEKVGFVNGRGSTTQTQVYSFDDNQPRNSLNYYRLKQIDFDGKFEYSKIEVVDFSTTEDDWIVFPNPVNGLLRISTKVAGDVNLQLINTLGQVVLVRKFSDGNELQMNVSDLPEGQYQLRIENSNTTKNIIKSIVIFRK